MNILLDISQLGLGHAGEKYRTGIFRVVDALTRQLISSEGDRLTLCASEHSLTAQSFVRTTPPYHAVPFARTTVQNLARSGHSHLTDRLLSTPPPQPLSLRAKRKGCHLLERALGREARFVGEKALADADIFHSTFYRIPDQAKRATRLKKFLTVYDLIPILQPQYFTSKEEAGRGPWLDGVVRSLGPDGFALCISEATKADVCEYLGLPPERAFVTPLAADGEMFHPGSDAAAIDGVRKKYGIPDGPYVLGLSTLAPHKNFEQVIRAFAQLVQEKEAEDLSLVLTGVKGKETDKIFREASSVPELGGRIIFTGRVADADLSALYSGALVFTYMSFCEGFGLPPLEAMQCGTPVITSDTSSLPEVVGDAGIMLGPRDRDGLCQAILGLYRSADLCREMSRRSLERARKFSWERCAQETLRAYEIALSA